MQRELTKHLQAKFPKRDLAVRPGSKSGGRAMALFYVTARSVQNRLDDVVGAMGWQVDFERAVNATTGEMGVEATISIYDPVRGFWVSKSDASQDTDVEGMKGGYSKALVRAGVQWGIGRYLYDIEKNIWHPLNDRGTFFKNVDALWKKFPDRLTPSDAPESTNAPETTLSTRELRKVRRAYEASDLSKEDAQALWGRFTEDEAMEVEDLLGALHSNTPARDLE